MFAYFNKIKESEDGQAIVLASISMLILALGVVATLNLGHAVHQKIRLQNIADSAAYSMAAQEARTFNFIAFTNRAQIVHYVSMMMLQTYLSYMYYVITFFAYVEKDMRFLQCVLRWINSGLSASFGAIASTMEGIRESIQSYSDLIDTIVGSIIIPTLWQINQLALYGSQLLMLEATGFYIAFDLVRNLLKEMDEFFQVATNIEGFLAMIGATMFNLNEYYNAFDPVGGGTQNSPMPKLPGLNSNDAEVVKAQRIMTELANGTRHEKFMVDRSGNNTNIDPILEGLTLPLPTNITHWGQTKLLTNQAVSNPKNVENTSFDNSKLAKGDNLTAYDEIKSSGFFAFKKSSWGFSNSKNEVASVQASKSDGKHCTATGVKRPSGILGFFCIGIKVIQDCYSCGNHEWAGIAPYLKFKPDPDPKNDFGQPSTFIVLNKSPDGLKKMFTFNFVYGSASGSERLDTSIGKKGVLGTRIFQGINVLSRGMAYYHRPGNWIEHPNFFNPFWRAKLAPVGDWLLNLLSSFGLPGEFNQIVQGNLITH